MSQLDYTDNKYCISASAASVKSSLLTLLSNSLILSIDLNPFPKDIAKGTDLETMISNTLGTKHDRKEKLHGRAKDLGITLKLPAIDHATDNALMIAIAGYFNRTKAVTDGNGLSEIKAEGNFSF